MPAIQDSGIANLYDRINRKSANFYSRWGHYPDRLLISKYDGHHLRNATIAAAVSFEHVCSGTFEFEGMRVLVSETPGILEVFRVD